MNPPVLSGAPLRAVVRPRQIQNKKELREIIRGLAKRIGRTPTRREFVRETGVSETRILKFYDTWNEAVKAAGLEACTRYRRISDRELIEDWKRVEKKIGGRPTRVKYRRLGKYDWSTYRRFGEWGKMGEVRDGETKRRRDGVGMGRSRKWKVESRATRRVSYGEPISFRSLGHEPTEEAGVIFLFGILAEELGFRVEALRGRFPDCLAKRRISNGKWEEVRIEFEFESRNFRQHGHPVSGCDLIVCWKHNWAGCPVEVMELSGIVASCGLRVAS